MPGKVYKLRKRDGSFVQNAPFGDLLLGRGQAIDKAKGTHNTVVGCDPEFNTAQLQDAEDEEFRQERLHRLSRTIRLTVSGGAIQAVDFLPYGYSLRVVDLDTDGADMDRDDVHETADGSTYYETIHE